MTSKIVPLLIHGEDIVLEDGTTFLANPDNPHYKSAPWVVQATTKELAIRAVNSCAGAFQGWRQTPLSERKVLFDRLAQILRAQASALASIIKEEICCSDVWASINVNDTIAVVEHLAALANSNTLSGVVPEVRATGSHAVVFKRPLGVVLGIAPWNAPAVLGIRAVAAPVMAGNCAILKGSELSPRTHHFVARTFREAGFPPGVVNFLIHKPEDAAEVYETIISQPAVRKCNFTGSTAVGRQIAMRAAFYLKPVLLELGGKNFSVVLEDANLDAASDMILEGALLNSGQICMSTDLVLVSSRVKPQLCKLLREKLQAFSASHVTRLVQSNSEARIKALRADAEKKGALLHSALISLESGVIDDQGRQYASMIENVTPDMEFWEQESFGPLFGVCECNTLDEAIATINACAYGLSAAIWTTPSLRIMDLAGKINVGAVHINGATVHDEATLPHGGCKDSGWGRFGGHWALDEFVQAQTVVVNSVVG